MNLLILAVLAAVLWALRVRWIKFREKRLDPKFEQIDDFVDDFIAWVKRMFNRKAR